MKKKYKIIAVILAFILLFPFSSVYCKDGGTHCLSAVLWGVTQHRSITDFEGRQGRNYGTSIRILFFEVYDSTHFVTEEEYRNMKS